ncbi:hypothetical protein QA601_05385 [Chitinispirillales bacterium ANBcel5]|uniref:hypothetical protein n=1 Tax=Cellulosispirillum alkaliphilum TaxID=3039283 RepID=UPI002A4E890A|nr:hypothetical protein [Chitinispirillales bacterium ANBcel5]
MRTRTQKKNSYIKALALLLVLIVGIILYSKISSGGMMSGLAGLLNADFENFRNLTRFDEDQLDAIREEFAGFWVYDFGDPEVDPVAVSERLELIDNGIAWHVITWTLNLPSGERERFHHVRNGYFVPYSLSHDSSTNLCEGIIIHQALVTEADTCYGESKALEMWELSFQDDNLNFNNRIFTKYDGELLEFFPDNDLLPLVDRIDVRACRMGLTLRHLSRASLKDNFDEVKGDRKTIVESIIEEYYTPLEIEEMVRGYDERAIPESIDVTLNISKEGEVTNFRNHSTSLVTARFNKELNREIKGWVFPAFQKDESFRITIPLK